MKKNSQSSTQLIFLKNLNLSLLKKYNHEISLLLIDQQFHNNCLLIKVFLIAGSLIYFRTYPDSSQLHQGCDTNTTATAEKATQGQRPKTDGPFVQIIPG